MVFHLTKEHDNNAMMFEYAIGRIFHLSDIHIKKNEHHNEYLQGFRTVIQSIQRNLENSSTVPGFKDIILISGDYLHNKLDISTEQILIGTSFILDLVKETGLPVFLIPGNHDLNLSNPSKLSPLYLIQERVQGHIQQQTQFFLLYHSQLISFENIDIFYWSIADDCKLFPSPSDKKKINCILWHGPVDGLSFKGIQLKNKRITQDDLLKFDMGLFGDIHSRMSPRTDKSRSFYYAGSLFQQNFGEDPDKGYLIWTLNDPSKKISPAIQEINPPILYLTLDLTFFEKKYRETEEIVNIFNEINAWAINSEKVFLRVIYSEKTSEKIALIDTIKTVFSKYVNANSDSESAGSRKNKITELYFSYKPMFASVSIEQTNRNNQHQKDILKTVFMEMLTNELKSRVGSQFSFILKEWSPLIDQTYHAFFEEYANNETVVQQWKLDSIELKNCFCHEHLKIDFNLSESKNIIGIFGKNGSGKTSILESISFCLFNRFPRSPYHRTTKTILKQGKTEGYVQLAISSEESSTNYVIKRSFFKKQDAFSQKLEVYCNGENIIDKEKKEMDKDIERLFGTYDNFILSNFSVQNEFAGVLAMSDKEKFSFFSKFFRLTADNAINSIKRERRQTREELLLLKETTDINVLKQEHAQTLSRIEELERESNEQKDKILELENSLSEFIARAQKIELEIQLNKQAERIQLSSEISRHTQTIEQLVSELRGLESEISNITTQIEQNQEDFRQLNKKLVSLFKSRSQTTSDNISELKSLTNNAHSLLKLGINLFEIQENPECNSCMTNPLVQLSRKIRNWGFNGYNEAKTYLSSYQSTMQEIEQKNKNIAEKERKLAELVERKMNRSAEYIKCLDRLDELRKTEQQNACSKTYVALTTELSNLRLTERQVKETLKKMNSEQEQRYVALGRLKERITALHTQIEQEQQKKEKRELLKMKEILLDALLALFSQQKGSFIEHLLQTQLEEMSFFLQSFSSEFGFNVRICNDPSEEGISIEFKNDGDDDDNYRNAGYLSGAEKFLLSILIRLYLIFKHQCSKVLLIDEGFGNLDEKNILKFKDKMFEFAREQSLYILFVSHREELKNEVNDFILLGT